MMQQNLTAETINEYGRFDTLRDSIDMDAAKDFFEEREHKKLEPYEVYDYSDQFLLEFILSGGKNMESATGKKRWHKKYGKK